MTAPKPRRRTIRFAIVAVVCLLLGAVTTVGVAWWIGNPGKIEETWFATHPMGPGNFPMEMRAPALYFMYADYRVPGATWLFAVKTAHSGSESTLVAGWPWLALCSEQTRPDQGWPSGPPQAWRLASWRAGIAAPLWWRSAHEFLPIRPLFPGFALDTALYAVAWYLLIFTPLPLIRAGRRRFRVSRGMCGSCGYDLNASTNRPCPECGA